MAHPHIATVIDYATDDRYCYLTTELYGCDMTDRINSADDEYLREDEAAAYFTQIFEALRHCHRQGVFHRDLKPDNILIDLATNEAKLTDFGSALVVDASDAATVEGECPSMMEKDDSDTHLPLTTPSPGRESAADAGSLSYSAPEVLGIRDEDSSMSKGSDNEGTRTPRTRERVGLGTHFAVAEPSSVLPPSILLPSASASGPSSHHHHPHPHPHPPLAPSLRTLALR